MNIQALEILHMLFVALTVFSHFYQLRPTDILYNYLKFLPYNYFQCPSLNLKLCSSDTWHSVS
jgi:hypothetical protein